MLLLGITYLTYSTTSSVVRTVLVASAYVLPTVALGLVAGNVVHRHTPANVVILINSLKVVLYSGLAVASATGVLNANNLLIFSALNGCAAAFTFPAWQRYIRGLVPDDQLDSINAAWASIISVGTLIGAVAGGFVINAFGVTATFIIDALTFIPLTITIALTPSEPPPASAHGSQPTRMSFQDVFQHIGERPELRMTLTRCAVLAMLLAPITQILPAIAAELQPGPHVLGLLTGALGVGAAFVAWRLATLKRRRTSGQLDHRMLIVSSLLLTSLGVAGLLLRPPWLGVPVGALLIGIGLMIDMGKAVRIAAIQTTSDPALEGGVLAVLGATFAICLTVGGLILASAADRVDVFAVLAVAGLALAAYTAGVVVRQRRAGTTTDVPTEVHDQRVGATLAQVFHFHR